MICGIQWVSELIEIAGGQDIFREFAQQPGPGGLTDGLDRLVEIISSFGDDSFSRGEGRP